LFPRTTNRYGCVTLHHYHFYVAEGLPQTQVLLWVYEDQLRAVVDSVVLAAYHCRYEGHTRHVRDIRYGIVYTTRFDSPQGTLVPRHAEGLWWSIAPKPHVVRVACPYQRSNCGCSSACIRPSEPRETLEVAHAGCWDNTLPSPMHYSLYGKSPSRDVDDRQNISSTSRASPAVFSPH
jgi:hypothetical protein